MRVKFVVDSLPCFKGFSQGSPVFLPPQKSTFLNSKSDHVLVSLISGLLVVS
jgi:hypothetical protein